MTGHLPGLGPVRGRPMSGPLGQGAPLVIRVAGVPIPQGQVSGLPQRNSRTGAPVVNQVTGRQVVRHVHTNKARLEPWRAAITAAAVRAAGGRRLGLAGPLVLGAVFTFARPQAHYRTGKYAALLREDAPARPGTKNLGDLDKLIRAVADALTEAGVWGDDAQVAEFGPRVAKVWAREDPDAFGVPGVLITVGELA